MKARRFFGLVPVLALLVVTSSGVGCALTPAPTGEAAWHTPVYPDLMPVGGGDLCPALDPPTGNTVTVSTVTELQDAEIGAGEFEIWGQQVNAATGAAVGIDTRLSDMGADGNADYDAQTPAVAYSGVSNNQYLVVWSGDESINNEFEIWAQRFTGGYKVYLPLALRNH